MKPQISYRRELPTGGFFELVVAGAGESYVRRWTMQEMPDHVRLEALLGAVTNILRLCLSEGPPGGRIVAVTFDLDGRVTMRDGAAHEPS